MYKSIVEIDLHGKNVYQARITIDAALRRTGKTAHRIRIIHGCNSGTALMDFIHEEYETHPLVRRVATGMNRGTTELVLREF